ncbi:MAG: Sec-independent protein translocase protein TatB [Hyphomicrobiales bacterium]|nr:Sec-independent protein translocase protein TatB [Hyphomicrobiales bacterium]
MFDIGWTEILIIAVVAIIVVGPKDLPGMLRSLGQYAGKMKRTAAEFRSQFDDALRDSELDELRSSVSDLGDLNPVNQIRDSVNESLNPLKETAEEIKSGIEDFGSSTTGSQPSEETEPAKESAAEKSADKPARKPKSKAKAAQKTAKAKTADAGAKTSSKGKASAAKTSPAESEG